MSLMAGGHVFFGRRVLVVAVIPFMQGYALVIIIDLHRVLAIDEAYFLAST